MQLSGPGCYPFTAFNTTCWNDNGDFYNGTDDLAQIMVTVPGDTGGTTDFDFCIND